MEHYARQGEVLILRLPDDTPEPHGWAALAPEGEHLIVGHSETGHHHVLEREAARILVDPKPPAGLTVLRAIVERPHEMRHLRGHDTHTAIPMAPGVYEIRTPVEFDHYAELARRVAD